MGHSLAPELLVRTKPLARRTLPRSAGGRKAMHKLAGEITLQQMLHEWAMHDLGHIRQIAELVRAQALAGSGAIGGVLSAQAVKSTAPWRSRLSCGASRSHNTLTLLK